jgi:uncharacterized protein (DUF2267 family)
MELYSPRSGVFDDEPNGVEMALDIERQAPLPPRTTGADALAAVMCSVLRRLDDANAEQLVGMAPPELKPILQTCPIHPFAAGAPAGNVIEMVAAHLALDVTRAEKTIAVVLEALLERLPLDAAARLVQMLPLEIRHAWA